ncbi:hypothetical protein [Corallibacter sp.]|uniref:hypothetical protein n=1 Tax=Corallibacter sp. TaxID=2038084 RepID=UPI003AB594CD
MIKLTHIINPVKVGESSDLYVAQPVTFESMKRAKKFAEQEVVVNLITTQFAEDHEIIPNYFTKTPDLERSILDIGTFTKQRKLPLIKDILERAVTYDDTADYIIYTNVDIALMPNFYLFVKAQIEQSEHDAFIINRRTIANHYNVETLQDAYSDFGKSHPGYDCFIFKKDVFQSFVLNNTYIGANWIGRAMYANLMVFSNSLKIIKDKHLTFHIGEDGAWLVNDYSEFDAFNKKQVYGVLNALLLVTNNTSKTRELKNVLMFMDDWGSQAKKKTPNLFLKLKKRVKKIIKAFYQ